MHTLTMGRKTNTKTRNRVRLYDRPTPLCHLLIAISLGVIVLGMSGKL